MRLLILIGVLFSLASFADEPTLAKEPILAAEPTLTPFSASYSTTYKLGWFTLNIDGKRVLKQLDNGHWQITFDASTSGASINEKSIFTVHNNQIVPIEYHYKTGGLLNKTPLNINFDAARKLIKDNNSNTTYKDLWQHNIQDNLTYIVQASIDLSQGKTKVDYPIFKSDYVKLYSYEVVGEEVINTKIGKLNTIKIERVGDNKDRTISAWFAIDYNYQLVRLNESKKGKTTYQIDISKLEELP